MSNTFTSPSLQRMLADEGGGNGESLDQRGFDIHCPQLPGELNAKRENCSLRLQSEDIPWDCRRCEVGLKVAQAEGFAPQKHTCHCGKESKAGYKSCQACIERGNKYRNDKRKTPEGRAAHNKKRRERYAEGKRSGGY